MSDPFYRRPQGAPADDPQWMAVIAQRHWLKLAAALAALALLGAIWLAWRLG